MRTLRAATIRLAYQHQDLRPWLLPLLVSTDPRVKTAVDTRREIERLRRLSERGDQSATDRLERWEQRRNDTWYDRARLELSVLERVGIENRGVRQEHGVPLAAMKAQRGGRGRSGESQWVGFPSQAAAQTYATARVQQQLQEHPENYDPGWIGQFMSVDSSAGAKLAAELTERYLRDLSDEDFVATGGQVDIDRRLDEIEEAEEALDEATPEERPLLSRELQALRDRWQEDLERGREETRQFTLREYLREMRDVPTFLPDVLNRTLKQPLPDFVVFDTESAAKDLLERDDIPHLLGFHDETHLPGGAVTFATD